MTMIKVQSVGKILKETRDKKKLSIEEVVQVIKIKEEYLVALENDEYEKLPSQPFTQGFIKNYARFLRIEPEILLAFFRRDFKKPTEKKIIPEGMLKPPKTFLKAWTPKTTMIIGVVLVLVLAGA